MGNSNYSEMREKRANGGGGKPPKERAGIRVSETPYHCPDWGLHGAPTQKKDRAAGLTHAKTYAKAEGLSEYDARPKGATWLDKEREKFGVSIHTPEAGKPTMSYKTPNPAEPTTESIRGEKRGREAGESTLPSKNAGKPTTPYKSYGRGRMTEEEKESLKDR